MIQFASTAAPTRLARAVLLPATALVATSKRNGASVRAGAAMAMGFVPNLGSAPNVGTTAAPPAVIVTPIMSCSAASMA